MGHNFITEKQEAYCQYRADGKPKAVAYRLAGYTSTNLQRSSEDACKLESNPKVSQRILEIKQERAERSLPERCRAESIQMDIMNSQADWFWTYDEKQEAWRLRKPYELSQRAWNCIKKVTKTGYEFHSKLEAIKVMAAMCGWNSIQVNQQTDSVLKFDTLYFGLPNELVEDAEG